MSDTSTNPNHPLSIFAYAYSSAVAVATLYFGPLLIGAYVEYESLTDTQSGYLFSIEMAGYALSSAFVFYLLTRMNWRHILLLGVLVLVGANIGSVFIHGYGAFTKFRFLSGLGAGLIMNMTMVSIGLTQNIDRNYGFWTVAQLIIGVIGLVILPGLILQFGVSCIFISIVILALFVLPLVKKFPEGGKQQTTSAKQKYGLGLGLMALTGIFIYYGGQAAVWAFVERIGVSADISTRDIGNLLSLSLLVAILSAIFATCLADRFGRRLPITLSMVCSAVGIALLWGTPSSIIYTCAVCMFNAAWYFCLPYLTAVIASIDSGGRLLVGLAVVFPASLSAGPALAAFLITGTTYTPVLIIGFLSLPLGLAIMWQATGNTEI